MRQRPKKMRVDYIGPFNPVTDTDDIRHKRWLWSVCYSDDWGDLDGYARWFTTATLKAWWALVRRLV